MAVVTQGRIIGIPFDSDEMAKLERVKIVFYMKQTKSGILLLQIFPCHWRKIGFSVFLNKYRNCINTSWMDKVPMGQIRPTGTFILPRTQ